MLWNFQNLKTEIWLNSKKENKSVSLIKIVVNNYNLKKI